MRFHEIAARTGHSTPAMRREKTWTVYAEMDVVAAAVAVVVVVVPADVSRFSLRRTTFDVIPPTYL